jgi:dolichol-phosphate mannosyltransferase
MARVVLALPAFNEVENLGSLVASAEAVLKRDNPDYTILVVDDGSTDGTGPLIDRMQAEGRIVAVHHPENRGLGGAILTAIDEALKHCPGDDDIVVNMDADDTHDPAYIPAMLDLIRRDVSDVVIASRYREGSSEVGVPLHRRLLSRGARMVFQVCLGLPDVRDYTCGYRAYRASLLRQARDKYGDRLITRRGFACTDELLVRLSTVSKRISEIPFVLRYDKKRGRSKLPLFRTVWETLRMLVLRD